MFSNFSTFILESKFYKGKLNSEFWTNDKFDQDVRKKLLAIAEDFYKDLKVDVPIEDIHLTGSLANFNWTKHSDLDVHILLDFSKVNKDVALVKKALDGERFMWNLRHPVTIRKHDVELYAQEKNEPHTASGLYSLKDDKWLIKPELSSPKIDEKDISRKVESYITEIEKSEEKLMKHPQEIYNRLMKIKSKIMKARKDGLADDGEFSIENLTFKSLRNDGWIEKIIDLCSKAYSETYSE